MKNCDISPCAFLAITAQFPLSSASARAKLSSNVSALTYDVNESLVFKRVPSLLSGRLALLAFSLVSWVMGTPSLYHVSSGLPVTFATILYGSSMAVFCKGTTFT